jgi:hypothetical protein
MPRAVRALSCKRSVAAAAAACLCDARTSVLMLAMLTKVLFLKLEKQSAVFGNRMSVAV